MPSFQDASGHLEALLKKVRSLGASAADAVLVEQESLSVPYRLGRSEGLERAEVMDLGLRVFFGHRQAIVSTTDCSKASLETLAERAVAMAKVVPEDPHCGLAEPEELAGSPPDLDLCDPDVPDVEQLMARARQTEEAARAVSGITNSEGAEAGWQRSDVTLLGTNGFSGAYTVTRHGLGVSVLAGSGTEMERDYGSSIAHHGQDLEAPEAVGRQAGERAVARLHPRKVPSAAVPVVFEARVAGGLLGHFASAINGAAIARGTSFLKDCLGKRIFPKNMRIVDDPHRPRGLASRPFDGEGVGNSRRDLVENGVLKSWLLDLRSARQLGLRSTGHAGRGISSPPSPGVTNFYLAPGDVSREALLKAIDNGFYVTELIGMGVNGLTGDYSRGAAGFWIEKGEIAYPVSEITIAGNLRDMFCNLTAADDLEFRYGVNAPTLRVDGMMVAGV
ncbi:MAG: modulator protein [Rhodospirillaceae bacterium]|nr:MAG: modulator protein [Rhodospirillaceae bacterium]